MQDKTTIVIVLNMDRILIFDKGEIVEDGSHNDLLANKKLWGAQIGGFLGDDK